MYATALVDINLEEMQKLEFFNDLDCQSLAEYFLIVAKGGKCQDINECLNNVCPGILECSNSDGSYACNCPSGYDTIDGICTVTD